MMMTPIGYLTTNLKEKYQAARQPGVSRQVTGVIHLDSGRQFEQALADLEGFERIWVIFTFDRNDNWKPKVQPPRGKKKRGLFATRSPHRPNPLGLSCVELLGIEGLKLYIGSHDLLDGTPILDIKPYLPYADSFPESKAGWVEKLEQEESYVIHWNTQAEAQRAFIVERGGPDLAVAVKNRLENSPFPHPSHRIKKLDSGCFELAYKSWRILYAVEKGCVSIEKIFSGYSDFSGEDRYGDFSLHQEFKDSTE